MPTIAFLRAVALIGLAAPLAALPHSVPAQSQAAPAKIDGRKVAEAMRDLLSANYVLPELRPKFATRINAGIRQGRYDGIDVGQLTNLLNEDLRSVTEDKHLHIMHDPKNSAEIASAPPHSGADDAPPGEADIVAANRQNHGLVQLKLLPGNIRYLETNGFIWVGAETERAYDNAVRFLAGGDAVIIDMRRNGGGHPEAVRYLTSHLTKPNTPLMTFYMGAQGTVKTATLPALRAPSLAGKPLYVLTGGGSASAAEEFVGHVAGYKLGTLVGANTAGAGFRNEYFALPEGFVISMSVGQAILESTGKGWEAVGFKPDVAVPEDQALNAAQALALKQVAMTADADRKKSLESVAAVLSAKASPVTPELPLSAYAGSFGERSIKVKDGRLIYSRGGKTWRDLIAIGPNLFAFDDEPTAQVQFITNAGAVSGYDLNMGDGAVVRVDRTP